MRSSSSSSHVAFSPISKLTTFLLLSMLTWTSAKVAIPDDETPIVKMTDYEPPYVPEGASYYFPKDFRILNCWECFEAHGKICKDKDHDPMGQHTGSGDPYNAFCCKQDYNEGYCEDGGSHDNIKGQPIDTVCSMSSHEDGTQKTKYKNVLSTDNRNHQMFAFCPNINQRKCGVSTDENTDMNLKATTKKQLVYSKDMRYRQGNDSHRETDACYYEITLSDRLTTNNINDLKEDEQNGELFIRLNFTKVKEMNVYIYGGKSRKTAYENMTLDNVQATLGQVYNISAYRGFLVVAYPNKDKDDTEFAFDFWAEWIAPPTELEEPEPADWFEFQGKSGENVFNGLVYSAIVMNIVICGLCVAHCVLRCKLKKLNTQEDGDKEKDDEKQYATTRVEKEQKDEGGDKAISPKAITPNGTTPNGTKVKSFIELQNELAQLDKEKSAENGDEPDAHDGGVQEGSEQVLGNQSEERKQTLTKQFYAVQKPDSRNDQRQTQIEDQNNFQIEDNIKKLYVEE